MSYLQRNSRADAPQPYRADTAETMDIKQLSISTPVNEYPQDPSLTNEKGPPKVLGEGPRRKREIFTFWLLFILSIAFGAGVSYGVLGPSYLTKSFDKTLPAGYGSGIYLVGVVNTLDLDSRYLSIQWIPYSCEETGPYSGCNALQDATNFFIDSAAAPGSSHDPTTAVLVYKANLTGFITDGYCLDQSECWQQQVRAGIPYEQTLQTTHQFGIRTATNNWRANSQAYPFDAYAVSTTFLALDPDTGSSRKILGVSLTGTVPNFQVEMHSRAVTNPAYPYEWRAITVKISRAQIVMAYAFLIWAINWLMTGVVMWITISAVQGRRRIPADLFGIPITALFALPTVRSIMPGAPFFGCILDYGGIILNLAVLTICSVALLLSVIARDAREFYSPEVRPKSLLGEPERPKSFIGRVFRRKSTAIPDDRANGRTGGGLGLSNV
ncbi:hypothetical protein FS837_001633 [Tulasnella sp. UAMH 9824]|nr:hypothetical protein FS837_001633 [Tulasnella sp. UAMH 9824]